MTTPINIRTLSEAEKGVLAEAIPVLRNKSTYYWEDTEFKRVYKKWLDVTKSSFVDGGFEQFRIAVKQMRRHVPSFYYTRSEKPDTREFTEDGLIIRKYVKESPGVSK